MRIVILFTLVLISSLTTCQAQQIFIDTFGNKDYYLETESVRLCANESGIYVANGKNDLLEATLVIYEKNPLPSRTPFEEKETNYSYLNVLVNATSSSIAQIDESTYNRQGSLISYKDHREYIKTVATGRGSIQNNGGMVSQTKETADIVYRKTNWIHASVESPTKTILDAITGYAKDNMEDVIRRGSSGQYITVSQ